MRLQRDIATGLVKGYVSISFTGSSQVITHCSGLSLSNFVCSI